MYPKKSGDFIHIDDSTAIRINQVVSVSHFRQGIWTYVKVRFTTGKEMNWKSTNINAADVAAEILRLI